MMRNKSSKKKKRKFKAKTLWRFVRRILLSAKESPKKRAQSTALAAFMSFTPLYGVQTYIGIALAFLFKLNRLRVGVLINVITPYPLVPLVIYLSFKIGGLFVEIPATISTNETFSWQLLQDNLVQYLAGGFILATFMGVVFGVVSYPLFIYLKKNTV